MNRQQQQRAVVVAALRELADLLESDESLPVPTHGGLQACAALGRPQGERFAAVRAFAERMDVDVHQSERGSRRAGRWFGPVEYYVHANADDYDGQPRYMERVIPPDEDADLLAAETQVAA